MKKRIFAAVAAVVVAATCISGLTACDGPFGGDDKVDSKEKWEKAWRDTASISSYILQINEMSKNEINEEDYVNVQLTYDGLHNTAHYQCMSDEYYYDAAEDIGDYKTEHEYHYYDGAAHIDYVYDYYASTWSEEELSADKWAEKNLVVYYTSLPILVLNADGANYDTFGNLYDYADYNESRNIYTLTSIEGTDNPTKVTYEIKFEKGYVSRIDKSYDEGFTRVHIFGINSTTVTIPGSVTGKDEKPGDRPKPEEPDEPSVDDKEWKAAIAASLAATSYTTTMGSNKNYYDGVNGYVKTNSGIYTLYYVSDGNSIIQYVETNLQGKLYYSRADQTEMYKNDLRQLGGLVTFIYNLQVEGSERTGTLSDLSDLFTYDATTDSYKCDTVLTAVDGFGMTFSYIEVSFKDGKIASYTTTASLQIGNNTTTRTDTNVISDYNKTVVTLPEGLVEYIESLK